MGHYMLLSFQYLLDPVRTYPSEARKTTRGILKQDMTKQYVARWLLLFLTETITNVSSDWGGGQDLSK